MRRIVVLAAVGALALTGCSLDAKEEHSARAFPFSGGTLTIKAPLGGLRLEQGTAGTVQVDRWLRGKAATDPSWSLRDGVVRLSATCRIVFGDCGGRYQLKVPPGVPVVVEGNDDGVIVNGLAQDVTVSAPGRIRVYGTAGALRLNGGDDSVSGERLTSGNVRVRTSGGGIDLAFTSAPARVDLMSGDGRVVASVPTGSYGVTVHSGDGRARSDIKDAGSGADRTIVARSGSGDVRVLSAS